MRHPISTVAAAAVFILALGGIALWFHGGGTKTAFADFIQPILEAKTAKFKMTTEITGTPPGMKGLSPEILKGQQMKPRARSWSLTPRTRQETEMPDKSKWVMISDWSQGKSLSLDPATKQATVMTCH